MLNSAAYALINSRLLKRENKTTTKKQLDTGIREIKNDQYGTKTDFSGFSFNWEKSMGTDGMTLISSP